MTDSVCSFTGDRDEALVTYLYGDGSDGVSRATFQAHMATCVRCADDLTALRGVRTQLARWSPPEPKFSESPSVVRSSVRSVRANPESRIPNPRSSWWREIPAWAQVAAALLFLGVSAGIANLDVRYDANGLSVRTGWLPSREARAGGSGVRPQDAGSGGAAAPAATLAAPTGTASQASLSTGGDAQWRAELTALERRLSAQMHSPQTAAAPRASADAELLRRVRALVDESEKRQQTELALRLAQAVRDMNAKREADLIRASRALGDVQNRLGVQVLKNSAQVQQMDYLIRTSQRQ
jgi:hypothetical protein